jgi:hypothetical protein
MATGRTRSLGGVIPLGAELLPLIPDAVRQASEKFAQALQRRSEAESVSMAAKAAAKAAPRQDQRAAAAAEAEGNPPPKTTAPALAAKAEGAQRVTDAAKTVAHGLQNEYLVAVDAAREQILTNAAAEVDRVAGDAAHHLDAVEEALVHTAAVRRLQRELSDPSALHGAAAMFNPSPHGKQVGRDPVSREVRERFEALRASLGVEQP